MGSKLPDVHVFPEQKGEVGNKYIKRFLIHPVKRRLAKYYLALLRKYFGIKVIGITGSAGKTTTKEMLTSILKLNGEVFGSYKNIDPVYNIPDTILRCRPLTKYLVLEMGVEYPGEMDYYLWLAKPDISVITNISHTHLKYFKNIDGVLREKKIIAQALSKNSSVVLNNDDANLSKIKKDIKAKLILFGKNTNIDSKEVNVTKHGTSFTLIIGKKLTKINLPLVGEHFVNDALAAAAAASVFEIPLKYIKNGLEEYDIPEHRMNVFNEKNGTLIIDDTYNNNPKAAQEALKVFINISTGKRRGIVFGDMLELGDQSEYHHRQLGKMIAGLNINFLICIGEETKYLLNEVQKHGNNISVYKTVKTDEIYRILTEYLGKDTAILLKGSRALALDEVVEKLSK